MRVNHGNNIAGIASTFRATPLFFDETGVIRIGRSRVGLSVVIGQYESGMAPEDIVRAYDSLRLADVHATIAYYLRHMVEVKEFLRRSELETDAIRDRAEAGDKLITRDSLLAGVRSPHDGNDTTGL